MPTTDTVDRFLVAEASANELIDHLTRLRGETQSYATAHQALGQTVQDITTLAQKMTDIATSLAQVASTLRDIGTPAILDGQKAMQRTIEGTTKALRAEIRSLKTLAIGTASALAIMIIVILVRLFFGLL